MMYLGAFILANCILMAFLMYRYAPEDHRQYDAPLTLPLMADADVSVEHEQVVAKLNTFNQRQSVDVTVARKNLEELLYREVDAAITPVEVNGIPGEWVQAQGANSSCRLLYLHGGAFRVGSPKSHRYLTNELSARCGVAVLAIDYRMQPEFKTRHCHEDARTAYEWLLHNGPEGPSSVEAMFVAGDSAGGNMTLSVVAWARDQGLRAADGAIAFAPLTDASLSSPTWKTNATTDPFLGPAIGPLLKLPRPLIGLAGRIPNGAPVNDPMISPLLGDLANLPNTLIQVSRDEMLYADSQRYANKANTQGSQVTLQVWPKMVHVFQGFPELPETQDALTRVTQFVSEQKPQGPSN